MIQVGTRLEVADNSGAKTVQCIRTDKKSVFIGDTILVSIKQMKHKGKVSKGDMSLAIVTETKKRTHRMDGTSFVCSRNAVVLVSAQGIPIGTRIYGSVPYELRAKNAVRLVSLATKTF
jgi:large subunit ribosomal protein L14